MRRVVCLGAAALDRKYHVLGDVQLATSNPVTGTRSFGGVARNVAENLARLGIDVALVSIVGDDKTGAALIAHLKRAGVDTAHVIVADGLATAEYVAILDRTSALTIGAADMAILDSIVTDEVGVGSRGARARRLALRRLQSAGRGPDVLARVRGQKRSGEQNSPSTRSQ